MLAQAVAPWQDLPFWMPASSENGPGLFTIDCRRAPVAGLTFRPLAGTVRYTLAWAKRRDPDWT